MLQLVPPFFLRTCNQLAMFLLWIRQLNSLKFTKNELLKRKNQKKLLFMILFYFGRTRIRVDILGSVPLPFDLF